jgi:Rieske Fe-S protein
MSQADLGPLDPSKGAWDNEALSRRKFLEITFWSVSGITVVGVLGVAARYLIGDSLDPKTVSWVQVGTLADLPAGSVHRVAYSLKAQDAWRVVEQTGALYAFSDDGASYTVLDGTCTHLGCVVQWQQSSSHYECPCHQGVFNRDGTVVSGPPPRPLRRLETKIDGGTLMAQI